MPRDKSRLKKTGRDLQMPYTQSMVRSTASFPRHCDVLVGSLCDIYRLPFCPPFFTSNYVGVSRSFHAQMRKCSKLCLTYHKGLIMENFCRDVRG